MEQEFEQRKRNTAYKLTIGEILHGKPTYGNERLMFVDIGGKNVVRVNILANCIDKFVSENQEKKYASLTVDDASGQIRLKVFGDEVSMVTDMGQGDTLQIIGNVRIWNDELYITPEIIKKVDPRWLLVRKLEIQNMRKTGGGSAGSADNTSAGTPANTSGGEHASAPSQGQGQSPSQNMVVRDDVVQKIKDAETDGGIDVD